MSYEMFYTGRVKNAENNFITNKIKNIFHYPVRHGIISKQDEFIELRRNGNNVLPPKLCLTTSPLPHPW